MYRLLIVDDIPDIVDSLYEFFTFNTELDVEKAYNGQQALDIAKSGKKIDILISDINIPDINGIDLHRQITELHPHCKAIFLTGYNDFEYIQQGLRQGAVDYIMKTEEDAVLIKSVDKAIQILHNEIQNSELKEKIRDFKTVMPMLQNSFLNDLLEGDVHSTFNMKQKFEELQINLNADKPLLILKAYVTPHNTQFNLEENIETLHGVREIVKEYISFVGTSVSIFAAKNEIVWLIQTSEDWLKVIQHIYDSMDAMQAVCKNEFNISISLMLSNEFVQWEDLQERYNIISIELDRATNLEPDVLMIFTDSEEDTARYSNKRHEDKIRFSLKKLSLLNLFLQNKQKDEYFAHLKNVLNIVSSSRSISYDILKEAYYSIAVLLLAFINTMRIGKRISAKIDLDKLTLFEHHASWDSAVKFIIEISEIIFEQMDRENEDHSKDLVSRMNAYIETHLSDGLSVNKIAQALNYNRSYLTRLCKEVTGNNLTEQIWQIRLAKAKELLEQKDVKISDIYRELGFENPSYFVRVFRKYMDLSPQEYRNKFIEPNEEEIEDA